VNKTIVPPTYTINKIKPINPLIIPTAKDLAIRSTRNSPPKEKGEIKTRKNLKKTIKSVFTIF